MIHYGAYTVLRGPLGLRFWVFRFSFKECRASEPFRGGSVAYMGLYKGSWGDIYHIIYIYIYNYIHVYRPQIENQIISKWGLGLRA